MTKQANKFPCRECGKEFTSPQGEALHYHRIHSGKVPTFKRGTHRRNHSREDSETTPAPSPENNGTTSGAPAKRRYTKQAAHVDITVNYCPVCGCDMKSVATGIALAAARAGHKQQ